MSVKLENNMHSCFQVPHYIGSHAESSEEFNYPLKGIWAPDKVHIFISICLFLHKNLFDHLLESSHRDDSKRELSVDNIACLWGLSLYPSLPT